MDFWKLFGIEREESNTTQHLGTLFLELDRLLAGYDEQELQLITGFSGLLGKVAYSDREISSLEIERIRSILGEMADLSDKALQSIVEVLEKHTVELCGLEDHHYTRILNSVASKEQRLAILKSLFAVAAANKSISFEEDKEISVIAKGLRLTHQEFIDVRRDFLEHLDILKK